jgi:hypothetical protein
MFMAYGAAAQEEQKAVRLQTPRQVQELCASLAPIERVRFRGDAVERGKARTAYRAARSDAFDRRYQVEVPGSQIVFVPYAEEEGELAVSPRSPLAAVRGMLRIWGSEDADLVVPVGREEARRVLEAQRARTLLLRLTFDLPDEEVDGSPCAHAAASRVYTLAVEPVSWVYTSRGEVLARGGEGADRPMITMAQGARPVVEVGEPLQGDSELRRVIAARNRELTACYTSALERDPTLDGTLALEVRANRGKAPSVRVAVDSMQDGALAGCVREVVSRPGLPGGVGATIPIRFTLAAPDTARQ